MSLRCDRAPAIGVDKPRPWPYAPRVILRDVADIGLHLAAIPASMLPARRWRGWPTLPVERMAAVGGLVTALVGLFFGARWFVAYASIVADVSADAAIELLRRDVPLTRGQVGSFSALSIFAFVLFTPQGWLATYLTVSGIWRAIAGWVEDPLGDPIVTGVDTLLSRAWRRSRASAARRSRERKEGAEVPDRLRTGEWAKLPGVDFVVVASRRKAGWTKGTFVITNDGWFTLAEPFDLLLPEGLRTVYPLTAQRAPEVLRRGVTYELPPLQERRPADAPRVNAGPADPATRP